MVAQAAQSEPSQSDIEQFEFTPAAKPLAAGIGGHKLRSRHRRGKRWWALAGFGMTLASLVIIVPRFWRLAGHETDAQAKTHVPSQQVLDLYLSGRFYWAKRTPADLKTAMSDFQKAAALDPQYAAAYAGIADCYALSPEFASMLAREAYPKMLVAAQRAQLLNPNLPEAHRALGFVLFHWNWDREGSRREFEEAIRLDPHDATTFHWYANVLVESQDFERALEMIDKARALDTAAPSVLADRGLILEKAGHAEEARQALTALERSDRTYLPPHWYLAGYAHNHRDGQGYLRELKEIAAVSQSSADGRHFEECSEGYRRGGVQGLLNADADFSVKASQQLQSGYFFTAVSLYLASRQDETLDYLELAYERRDSAFPVLSNPGSFQRLAGRPQFDQLLARSKLPYPSVIAPVQVTKPMLRPVAMTIGTSRSATIP